MRRPRVRGQNIIVIAIVIIDVIIIAIVITVVIIIAIVILAVIILIIILIITVTKHHHRARSAIMPETCGIGSMPVRFGEGVDPNPCLESWQYQ